MTRNTLHVLLAAGMVLLAGCAGGISGTPATADGDAVDSGDGTATVAGTGGTVTFYVSDQPNAIGDFEHLNVTITTVGFQQAGGGEADDNETETPDNETEKPDGEAASDEFEDGGGDDRDESGGWVEFAVDDRTVDLTDLQGDRATQIDQYDVPNGTYNKVFVHVSDVNATLTTGERVNVKLPSSKLQIDERFAVGNGSDIDFVFDIAVHKAGKSGKYILNPVISESGTDVPIEAVDDENGGDDGEREDGDGQRDGEQSSSLDATFLGNVSVGENATIEVTSDGDVVTNATVYLDGDRVGTTDADGRLSFTVPDREEFEVTVRHGEAEAELEWEFDSDS